MNRETILSDMIDPLVALLSQKGLGDFHVSSIPLEIDGTAFGGGRERMQGYYAFSGSQAIRLEIVDDYLHGVAIWKTLGDLNSPDLRIEVTSMSEEEIVEAIVTALGFNEMSESVRKLYEGYQDDYAQFMQSIGPEAQGKKIVTLYRAYVEWAVTNGLRTMSYARFGGFVKEQQLGGGGAGMNVLSKAQNREQTVVQPKEMTEFEKDIMQNEVLYTANMLDSTLRRMAADDPGIVSLFLCGGAGLGKAQPHHSRILTPAGWTTMGDIKPGDQVLTPAGRVAKVLDKFPQGEKEIFEITLRDGSKAQSCKEHLWKVKDGKAFKIKELGSFMERANIAANSSRKNYSLPLCRPIEFEKKPLSVDPYVLGLLLGDGTFVKKIGYCTADVELRNSIESWAIEEGCEFHPCSDTDWILRSKSKESGRRGKNNAADKIKALGLSETNCYTKFIPREYLLSSIEDRMQLLRGLMDTDGYVNDTGDTVQFGTSSPLLAENFRELVKSLGGYCYQKTYAPAYYNEKYQEKRVSENLHTCFTINLPSNLGNPFQLKRKADRYAKNKGKQKHETSSIVSIEYVGNFEASCIVIDDSDHLYITDDYIPTHNSFSTKKILKEEGVWVDPPNPEDPSVHGKVVYKSGSIAGFTGLLQILWDYRKDFIVVLDDNDSILAIPKAANILKACLNSNPEDRWVSYTKLRK